MPDKCSMFNVHKYKNKCLKILCLIFILKLINCDDCFSQIEDCTLIVLDSNGVRKAVSDVTLEYLKSDTLTYSESRVIKKVSLNDLISLKYYSTVKPLKGFIIGGVAGLAVYAGSVLLITGIDHSSSSPEFKEVFIGSAISAFIGSMLGGVFQSSKSKSKVIIFSELNINEAREELIGIIEKSDGRKDIYRK